MLADPELLVLDEPTAGVDVRTRHEVLHLLGDLNAEGRAVLVTTHDLNGIAAHLPRLWCINGNLVADGPPSRCSPPPRSRPPSAPRWRSSNTWVCPW